MELQLTGKVEKVLDVQSFSKRDGSTGFRFSFVLKVDGQYPYRVVFSVLGLDKWNSMNIQAGGTYSISFYVSSREWNGRWFTECSAWKAVRVDGAQSQAAQPTQQPTAQSAPPPPTAQVQTNIPKEEGELPF